MKIISYLCAVKPKNSITNETFLLIFRIVVDFRQLWKVRQPARQSPL